MIVNQSMNIKNTKNVLVVEQEFACKNSMASSIDFLINKYYCGGVSTNKAKATAGTVGGQRGLCQPTMWKTLTALLPMRWVTAKIQSSVSTRIRPKRHKEIKLCATSDFLITIELCVYESMYHRAGVNAVRSSTLLENTTCLLK